MNYSQTVNLPTEFRLALACCRWAYAGGPDDAVEQAARGVDWERFAAVASRHRIEALAWHSLSGVGVAVPEAVARRLSAAAQSTAQQGLRAAVESGRLLRAFEQAGIPVVFLKGLALGKLAYPSPFLKMSWDIDLLVAAPAIGESAQLLEELGYDLLVPGPALRPRIAEWHRRQKESQWANADNGIHVELHGRLTDNPELLPSIGIASPRRLVEVAPGLVLPTLAEDENFAYLAIHGAASGWHRLKWLADFTALLHGRGEEEIARLYATSQALGAGRAAGQALLIAHMLFDAAIGEAVRHRLASDRATRWLVRIALKQMTGRADLREPTEVRLGTLTIHASQLLVTPDWAGKCRELMRKVRELGRKTR